LTTFKKRDLFSHEQEISRRVFRLETPPFDTFNEALETRNIETATRGEKILIPS